MMQVIESVDPLYEALISKGALIDVHKPTLVRRLLATLDGKYDEYLRQSDEDKLKCAMGLYLSEMVKKRTCGEPQGTVAETQRGNR